MTSKNSIKAENLFIVTSGDYSDYQVVALVKAKVDFDLEAAHKEFVLNSRDKSSEGFAGFLLGIGIVEQVSCQEINTDIYGGMDSRDPPLVIDIEEVE